MGVAVELKNIIKRYRELVAVDHVSLRINEGEIFGLLGPNGSGKTTLIKCMLALLRCDRGSIRVFGQVMRPDAYAIKQRIGVVPQDVAVFDELSVYENIDYFCGLYIKDKSDRKQCVQEAMDFVGLEEYQKFYPGKLSGGLLRRLNIACGIAHKPDLIFFDEPTVAVDPQSRNRILEGITHLQAQGATIVYTSHYMEEIEQICNRIAIMDHGRAIATGTQEQLKHMIKNTETITVVVPQLTKQQLDKIAQLPHLYETDYHDVSLRLRYSGGEQNLVQLLEYFRKEGIVFGQVYTELPTLNDVFLEITGRKLQE
ncbi:MAG: ABC transporter ATP-binding protein [Eubacteriales bacterium]|nr:ABC transporter ATP-binding protein [Eubacteriales bacterium]